MVWWDGGTSLIMQMDANVTAQLAEDDYIYVKASSAISLGQLVYFTGAVGASGVVFGVTVSAELAWLSPKVFEAVTVTLYVRPFVNSLIVHESAPVLQVQLRGGNAGVPDASARAV